VKVSPLQGHQASAMEKSSQAFEIGQNSDGDWRLEELQVGKVRDLEAGNDRSISRHAELAWELQDIRKWRLTF
jgi:hypothetical protein